LEKASKGVLKTCCGTYDEHDIYKEQYLLKTKELALVDSLISREFYGYGKECDEEEKLRDIRFYRSMLGNYQCWDCKQLQSLIEKSKSIHQSYCGSFDDIVKDVSKTEVNVLLRKDCVPHETYEKAAYELCKLLNITFSVKEQVCDFSYDIAVNNISCDFLYALKVTRQYCDMGYSLKYTKSECKINYDMLHKKYDCGFTFNTYSKLLDCGMSHTAILQAVQCGMTFKVSKGDAILCSTDKEYNLSVLNVESLVVNNCVDCGLDQEVNIETINNSIEEEFKG